MFSLPSMQFFRLSVPKTVFTVLSSPALFFALYTVCNSFMFNGLMSWNVLGSSDNSFFLSLTKPFIFKHSSLVDIVLRNMISLSGGQLESSSWRFCLGSRMVALPSLANFLWTTVSRRLNRRAFFPDSSLRIISRNSFLPRTRLALLKSVFLSVTPDTAVCSTHTAQVRFPWSVSILTSLLLWVPTSLSAWTS